MKRKKLCENEGAKHSSLFSSGLYRRYGNFTHSAHKVFADCHRRCGISPRPKDYFRISLFGQRNARKENRQGANRLNFASAKFCTRFPLWNPLLFKRRSGKLIEIHKNLGIRCLYQEAFSLRQSKRGFQRRKLFFGSRLLRYLHLIRHLLRKCHLPLRGRQVNAAHLL